MIVKSVEISLSYAFLTILRISHHHYPYISNSTGFELHIGLSSNSTQLHIVFFLLNNRHT